LRVQQVQQVADAYVQRVLAIARDMRADGLSVWAIVFELAAIGCFNRRGREFSVATVHAMLREPALPLEAFPRGRKSVHDPRKQRTRHVGHRTPRASPSGGGDRVLRKIVSKHGQSSPAARPEDAHIDSPAQKPVTQSREPPRLAHHAKGWHLSRSR
jgi:hypothetical protein